MREMKHLQRVLDVVRECGTATVEDVIAVMEIPKRSAGTYLSVLASKKLIKRTGVRRYSNEALNPGPRTREYRIGRPCTEFKAI